MRNKKRIPIIMKALEDDYNNLFKVSVYFYGKVNRISFKDRWEKFKEIKDRILSFWLENPDLRLLQVLDYFNIIPYTFYGHIEDEDLFTKLEILQPRDIYFWCRNYDENQNLLKEPELILIKDINDGHLRALIDGKFGSDFYRMLFKEELNYRINALIKLLDGISKEEQDKIDNKMLFSKKIFDEMTKQEFFSGTKEFTQDEISLLKKLLKIKL